MATPRKCSGIVGKMCNCFLPAVHEDSHDLYIVCTVSSAVLTYPVSIVRNGSVNSSSSSFSGFSSPIPITKGDCSSEPGPLGLQNITLLFHHLMIIVVISVLMMSSITSTTQSHSSPVVSSF